MKTPKIIYTVLVLFFFTTSCDNSSDDTVPDVNLIASGSAYLSPENSGNPGGRIVEVTVPFKADFIGEYINVFVDQTCPPPQTVRVIVDFEGTGTHLGKFTGNFNFCADAEGNYGPTDSYMVAANGDILYISVAGQVIQGRAEDHPDYVTSYWRDPFIIEGGTGRFEGATGEGYTDDYNSSDDPNSHHRWEGTITLKKGNM